MEEPSASRLDESSFGCSRPRSGASTPSHSRTNSGGRIISRGHSRQASGGDPFHRVQLADVTGRPHTPVEDAAVSVQRLVRGHSARNLAAVELSREHRGWLWTQSAATCCGSMRRYWFVLQRDMLVFYRGEWGTPETVSADSDPLLHRPQRPLGAIALTKLKCYSTVPLCGRQFCFRVEGGGKSHLLAAESADERRLWVSTLLQHRSGHLGEHVRHRVLFFYGRGGGGHKASANAVRDCLTRVTTPV
jgi:hypothetical protein